MTDNAKPKMSKEQAMPSAENRPEKAGSAAADGASANTDADPIAQALRNAYQSTIDEGVPDDFMDLIRKLD